MFDIRDHGGVFGSKKEEPSTARLLGSKVFNNPFGTTFMYGQLIDEDTVELFTPNAADGNKKLTYSTLAIANITSKNTYLNTRRTRFVPFNDYFIEVASGVNFIKIYDKNKNLIKQITLGSTNFTSTPTVNVIYGGDFAFITCQTNDYYGTYVSYRLYRDLTVSSGISTRVFVSNWFPTETTIIGIYDGYLYICDINTGNILKSYTIDVNARISIPYFAKNKYLFSIAAIDAYSNYEKVFVRTFNGTEFTDSEQTAAGHDSNILARPGDENPIIINQKDKSVMYMGQSSSSVKKFRLTKNNKAVLTTSNYGSSFYTGYGFPQFCYDPNKSKVFYIIIPNNDTRSQYKINKYILE